MRLKPKGVAVNSHCEQIAIANGKNVLLVNFWEGTLTVIGDKLEHTVFGFANDVAIDMHCNLLIADMGEQAIGRTPRDGRLWRYVVDTGELIRIEASKHRWVNPAHLDLDVEGNLYVIDEEAGPAMPGSGEMHFDAIFKLGMPRFRVANAVFTASGLTATAFMVHPDGRYWVGMGEDLVIIDNRTMKLTTPCSGAAPFTHVTGLSINSKFRVFAMDGFSVYGKPVLRAIDDSCMTRKVKADQRLAGAQGLAVFLPPR